MSPTGPVATESKRCRRVYDAVAQQSERLLELAAGADERLFYRAEPVSAWSVADHLGHLAKANQAMAGALQKALGSEGASGGRGPSLVGRAVLLTGWIPRGVGKAPEYVQPQASSSEDLGNQLHESRRAVGQLERQLPEIEAASGCANHFAFGDLTPYRWLKIIEIHNRHHLKIIRAIQRAPGSPWKSSVQSNEDLG